MDGNHQSSSDHHDDAEHSIESEQSKQQWTDRWGDCRKHLQLLTPATNAMLRRLEGRTDRVDEWRVDWQRATGRAGGYLDMLQRCDAMQCTTAGASGGSGPQ